MIFFFLSPPKKNKSTSINFTVCEQYFIYIFNIFKTKCTIYLNNFVIYINLQKGYWIVVCYNY